MTGPLRRLAHLGARFFDVLFSKALSSEERGEVSAWLDTDAERRIFWEQPSADQRHGLGAARHVAKRRRTRRDLIRAALLHDVGKRHAALGVLGRSFAALTTMLPIASSERIAGYLNHGPIGADDLAAAGANGIVVSYARHHHNGCPIDISAEDWAILDSADRFRR